MLWADETFEFRGDLDVWSLPFNVRTDGRFGAREGGANSAADTGASGSGRHNDSSGTRLGRIWPLGDDAATSTGDGSTFFASSAAAATRCDSRSNTPGGRLVSDDCASGLNVVASLGRRRTSTVNEGTARLNDVLATAHRGADSSRRRRPCEAKRNKAIGTHCGGDKRAVAAAPVLVLFTALAHWVGGRRL